MAKLFPLSLLSKWFGRNNTPVAEKKPDAVQQAARSIITSAPKSIASQKPAALYYQPVRKAVQLRPPGKPTKIKTLADYHAKPADEIDGR